MKELKIKFLSSCLQWTVNYLGKCRTHFITFREFCCLCLWV